MNIFQGSSLYGFGTHRLKDDIAYESVKYALKQGYNLIDTAEKYYNSVEIGKAIKDSGVDRNNIAIVHKLTDVLEFSRTEEETRSKVNQYLNELDTNYIDILLMHGPSPRYHKAPELFVAGNIEVWNTFIKLKREGVLRAIGVSNFHKHQIMYLIAATGVQPDFIEVEFNPINYHETIDLIKWSHSMGIRVIGYSPLGAGNIDLIAESDFYKDYGSLLSPVEFALRFSLTHLVIPIPRSSHPTRIKENLEYLKKGLLL